MIVAFLSGAVVALFAVGFVIVAGAALYGVALRWEEDQ